MYSSLSISSAPAGPANKLISLVDVGRQLKRRAFLLSHEETEALFRERHYVMVSGQACFCVSEVSRREALCRFDVAVEGWSRKFHFEDRRITERYRASEAVKRFFLVAEEGVLQLRKASDTEEVFVSSKIGSIFYGVPRYLLTNFGEPSGSLTSIVVREHGSNQLEFSLWSGRLGDSEEGRLVLSISKLVKRKKQEMKLLTIAELTNILQAYVQNKLTVTVSAGMCHKDRYSPS